MPILGSRICRIGCASQWPTSIASDRFAICLAHSKSGYFTKKIAKKKQKWQLCSRQPVLFVVPADQEQQQQQQQQSTGAQFSMLQIYSITQFQYCFLFFSCQHFICLSPIFGPMLSNGEQVNVDLKLLTIIDFCRLYSTL